MSVINNSLNPAAFGEQFSDGAFKSLKKNLQHVVGNNAPDKDGVVNFAVSIVDGITDSIFKRIMGSALFVNEGLSWWNIGKLALSKIKSGLPLLAANAIWIATPLAVHHAFFILKENLGVPKLVTNQRGFTLYSRLESNFNYLYSRISGNYNLKPEPVFNSEVKRKIDSFAYAIPNIQKKGGYFHNLLLHGPAGVGKTMIAKKIAEDAGMSYVMISGGDLGQYIKAGTHVTQLNELFKKIKNASTPVILFIDEIEGLGRDRASPLSSKAELTELINAFLNHTGEPSKKFMIIGATNRVNDLDPAILDRFDYKIFIELPREEEREKIISLYLPQFFSTEEISSYFAKEVIRHIAARTQGLSARAIFKMLNVIHNNKFFTTNSEMTEKFIMQTVEDFVSQESAGFSAH